MLSFRAIAALALTTLIAIACSSPTPTARPDSFNSPSQAAPEARKTLTIAAGNTILGFGIQAAGTTGGGARSLIELHSNGLATTDPKGAIIARLGAQLPSFNDGTIVVLPDGRLQTTWKLRPN